LPRQRLDAALQALHRGFERRIERRRGLLAQLARQLAGRSPAAILALSRQRLNEAARQLPLRKAAAITERRKHLAHLGRQLAAGFRSSLQRQADAHRLALARLASLEARMKASLREMLSGRAVRLEGMGRLLDSVSYRHVLARGYALVHDQRGRPLRKAGDIAAGQLLTLEFVDGKVGAVADNGGVRPSRKRGASLRGDATPSLFE
jgi:exodeoxyribonuclease VII large subunit